MHLSAGLGEGVDYDGDGGSIAVSAGKSINSNGGHIVLQSGSSEQTTSGSVGKKRHCLRFWSSKFYSSLGSYAASLSFAVIDTANAGEYGESGFMRLTTGNSDAANTGSILISTGNAVDEKTLIPHTPTYKGGDSGSINVTAGLAVNRGGNLTLVAGGATGQILRSKYDRADQQGGNVFISSGHSIEASSGEVTVGSASAGKKGDAGKMTISTGDAQKGNAGMIGEYCSMILRCHQ
jgi:hypothetical protein